MLILIDFRFFEMEKKRALKAIFTKSEIIRHTYFVFTTRAINTCLLTSNLLLLLLLLLLLE